MNLRKHLHSAILGWGLSVALGIFVAATSAPGQAQSNPNAQNPDLTRHEVATFDQFLDQHPDIDQQLRSNPSLVNNADFVENHPDLGKFLAGHPEVREELKENPSNFMHREQRFDMREESREHNSNPDLNRKQVATFDQFLDQHPDIDRQLRSNPSLVNNADFVGDHPDLGKFLASHPEVREELKENPGNFMHREQRFDSREESRERNPNPDVTRKEVSSFDHFLDKHPDLDKKLDANPGLVNDPDFLNHHHELKTFLKDHPEVREEMRENASAFMRREQRFDNVDNRARSANPDLNRKELASFDQFLDHHKNIDKDLEKDPNRINDPKFLKEHSDLRKFMEKHPQISEEFKENPRDFMRQESRFERSDRDRHMDRDARADKDKHKTDKDDKSALDDKSKLQTSNPH